MWKHIRKKKERANTMKNIEQTAKGLGVATPQNLMNNIPAATPGEAETRSKSQIRKEKKQAAAAIKAPPPSTEFLSERARVVTSPFDECPPSVVTATSSSSLMGGRTQRSETALEAVPSSGPAAAPATQGGAARPKPY